MEIIVKNERFHYYLCRRLGGGMEIVMKVIIISARDENKVYDEAGSRCGKK